MIIRNRDKKATSFSLLRPHVWVVILSTGIILILFGWSLMNYQPVQNIYGPRAIYSLAILSVSLTLLGRILLLRMLRAELAAQESLHQRVREAWRPLFLFDLAAPLYLAAGVLVGASAAVLTALVTQIILQAYTLLRGFINWTEACYRIASTGLLVLISTSIYIWVAGPGHNYFDDTPPLYHLAESKEFLGSILAAAIMLLLIILASLPIIAQIQPTTDMEHDERPYMRLWFRLRAAWRNYLNAPALRFQVLVLSVGPLLPVVDIFDNAAAELAWLFFLVPLFAIYYLALNSTRLSIRTGELQRTLQDLSSARRRQGELRDYASLITRVQEEERSRLARELHDDTAQALIALSLGLDGLGRAIGKRNLPEKDFEWLSSLHNLADSTLEGVRRACRDLRPSVLDDLGLRAALEWLSDSSASRGVPCTFFCQGKPLPTSPEAEIAIFRIVQEALSNIWRHSSATRAEILLKYLPDYLQVTIHDNGKGFDTSQQSIEISHNEQSGLGLGGMRERAILIGAKLSIISAPTGGCTIFLSLPITS